MTVSIAGIPAELNAKLVEEYLEIKKHFAMNDWGPGQLKGGRFAEVVLRMYQHLLGDAVTPFGVDIRPAEKTRILNTVESAGAIDVHIRQKTVPLIRLLLDFRNNRDVAHLGGFDANSMDTLFVVTSATWILCELIRVYGNYTMAEAQKIADQLAIKDYPVIMERAGELFITQHNLNSREEVLIWLTRNETATAQAMADKVSDSNGSRFRGTLKDLVKDKFIGVNGQNEYFIMPRGQALVAEKSLLTYRR
jgi:hypothetical protein